MTEGEKQLLLQDLSARLPYGVQVEIQGFHSGVLRGIDGDTVSTDRGINYPLKYVKSYLRPMSSMTEEEVKDLLKIHIRTKYGEDSDYYKNLIRIEKISKRDNNSWSVWIVFKNSYDKCISTTCFIIGRITFETTINEIDWLNAHHFDFRRLIKKGLAIEAPKGMY